MTPSRPLKIKYVFFDIGGVLLTDFSGNGGHDELLEELGATPSTRHKFENIWSVWEPWACLNADVDDLLPILTATGFNPPHPTYSLLDHGLVKRFRPNQSIWPLVDGLQPHRCGIISNMYPRMRNLIQEQTLLPPAIAKWFNILDSSELGLQKPNIDIFEYAAATVSYSPSEILFVDNMADNLIAPQTLGWQVFHYDSTDHRSSVAQLSRILEDSSVVIQ